MSALGWIRARRWTPYDALRIALAILLLTAAGLKAHQLATEPVIGTGFLDSRWVLIVTVEFELFFGLWLLANIWRKPSWAAALTCFGLFTCVSLYKALSGYDSCQCLGRVRLNPWGMLTLDLMIAFSLLRWRPRGEEPLFAVRLRQLPSRAVGVLAIWLVIGVPVALAMGGYVATALSDTGDVLGEGRTVVLEPEKWVGKRFPLLPFVEDVSGIRQPRQQSLRHRLTNGDWIVVLYHHDCLRCQKALRIYEELVCRSANEAAPPHVALIEMPPYGDPRRLPVSPASTCVMGRLREDKEWFAATPMNIVCEHGTVTRLLEIKTEEQSERFADR